MTETNPKQATDTWVVKLLNPTVDVPASELRMALADALKRIASIEKDWEGLGEVFRMFNEQNAAARKFGSGILNEQ